MHSKNLSEVFEWETFYNDCLKRTAHINSLLNELTSVQREQQEFQFDFSSVDATSKARLEFSKIRNQLASYSQQVEESVRDTERLCEEGVETLSPEQFHNLKENQQKLRSTYESIVKQTESVLDRLDLATALLIEFSTKSSQLQSWIFEKSGQLSDLRLRSGDPNNLANAKRELKILEDEISLRSSELKTISQLAARINVEICNYIDELRRKDVAAAHLLPQLHRQQINETVDRVLEDYAALIRAKNELLQFLNRLKNLALDYDEKLSDVTNWLSDLEDAISNPDVFNTSSTEKRLNDLLHLKQATVENQPKIDNFNSSARQLVDATISTSSHEKNQAEQEERIARIQKRYRNISERLDDGVNTARAEITQKEGLQQSLQSMAQWLDEAEQTMLTSRSMPLDSAKLNDFKYDNQLKYSELNSKLKTMDDISRILQKMQQNSPALIESEGLDTKLQQTGRRLQRLNSGVMALNENLLDLIEAFTWLQVKSASINEKQLELMEVIGELDATNTQALSSVKDRLTRLVVDDWNELESLAKKVLAIPDIEDTRVVDNLMRTTEIALSRLQKALESKLSSGQKLSENRLKFHEKFDEVNSKLHDIESQLSTRFRIELFDAETLSNQTNLVKQLKQDLNEIRDKLNEVENLGTEFIQSTGIRSKRRSMDLETVAGSGETIGQITRQLFELRKRYDDTERCLLDTTQRINECKEHINDWNTQRGVLERWIANELNQLNDAKTNGLSLNENKMSALQTKLKAFNEKRLKKQSELAAIHLKTQQLRSYCDDGNENENPPSLAHIKLANQRLDNEWSRLKESTKDFEKCALLIQQFIQSEKSLDKWLTTKTKMFSKLCSTLADLKLVDNHLVVVQMLESEYKDEEQRWTNFNDAASRVITLSDSSQQFNQEIMQNVDEINRRWKSLGENISTRNELLLSIQLLSTEFEAIQENIKYSLLTSGEKINSATNLSNDIEEERLAKLKRLDEAQQFINDLSPQAEKLQQYQSEIQALMPEDSTLHLNVNEKVCATKRSIEELLRKIEMLRTAATSTLVEKSQLVNKLDALLDYVKAKSTEFGAQPMIPVDFQKLKEFSEAFDNFYQDVHGKESEIIIINSKLADLLNRSPDAGLKHKLRVLSDQWQPLLANTKTRRQNAEKAEKLLDEYNSIEGEVKDTLSLILADMDELKKNDTSNVSCAPIESKLHALEPKIETALFHLQHLETVCGGASSDMKKLKLSMETIRQNRADMLDDCQTFIEFLRNKNDLRNKFDTNVKQMHAYLDAIRSDCKLSDEFTESERLAMGKELFKTGLSKFETKWKQQLSDLNSIAGNLSKIADVNENSEIKEALDDLEANSEELLEAFNRIIKKFEKNEDAFGEIQKRGSNLAAIVAEVLEKIGAISPIGRDLPTLKNQAEEVDEFLALLDTKNDAVQAITDECKHEMSDKAAQNAMLYDVDRLAHQIDRCRAEMGQRKRAIFSTHERIESLAKDIDLVLDEMNKTRSSEIFALPPSTDITELRQRQNSVKHFKSTDLRLIANKVDDITSICKELIRSASPDVSTQELEESMSLVSKKWQELTSLVEDHERRIDLSVQGLGSYHDAHMALVNWLEETEDLVNSQKPPSADYKVVKAQLQNYDFQLKLVNDKQSSVEGFLSMIEKLKSLANHAEQKSQFELKASEIFNRYNELVISAKNRRQQLLNAETLTYEFSQLTQSLSKFLDDTNKSLQVFSKIPTDAERLQEQILFQRDLQDQTDKMRPSFDHLVELYSEIVKFVDVEDANELEATVRSLTFRYNEVGTRCTNCGILLAALAEDISSFIQNTNQLTEWLDSAEQEIEKFGQISSVPEELEEQSKELTKLAISVAEQGALVSQVVEESRELCTHASGSEAIALQYRIDCLRNRYSQLAVDAEQKIAILSKAIPLSEELHEGFHEITEFLNGVEEDLENLDQVSLEEQFQLVETITTELVQFRSHLDDELQPMCLELQRLSCEKKANELAKENQEMVQRFITISDMVAQKANQLKNAERQSRHTFDVLEFWIDWFNETRESILQAEKPSVDIEFLKTQLKHVRLLNEEIANERAGLRNIIVDASKIARDLNSTFANQDNGLIAKVEKAKKLAEDTAELGLDRVNELEQAFVLCKELDESYTELSDWMDEIERELQNCEPITTGMSPKVLVQQQLHNNGMLQAVQSQRSMISKFERNINALTELCSEKDAANLRQISDQVMERFNDLANAFRERGDALASTIEQSSEFADRLNIFLANLQGAVNQIRHSEPPSARPPILQQQIADNLEILELVKQKEDSFKAMKNNAQEVLSQTKGNEPAVREIAQNIEVLDDLWLELQSGSKTRHNFLAECLRRAEVFWAEYETSQNAILSYGQNLDTLHSEVSLLGPDQVAIGQQKLAEVNAQLNGPMLAGVEKMRVAGAQLCESLNDDERTYVEQHLVLFDSNWNAFTQLFTQMSLSLNSNMNKTTRFYELLARLQGWLSGVEVRVGELPQLLPQNDNEIRSELNIVEAIRREMNENVLHREQLAHIAAEICASAPAAQANNIRNSVNDLNQRWNKLTAQLTERLQRLERAMLDLGQFTQAHDQLSTWIDKTKGTLDAMNLQPDSLKHVEIELCKFRVVQNDIYAHLPSFEAIQKAGKALIKTEPESAPVTQPILDSLAERWNALSEQAEQIWTQLEVAKTAAGHRSSELEKWAFWLSDVLAELKTGKLLGGLPQTAQAQLDDFRIVAADVEQKRDDLEAELERLEQHFAASSSASSTTSAEDHDHKRKKSKKAKLDDTYLEKQYAQLKKDWETVQKKLIDREMKLIDALRNAIELQNGINEVSDWLTDAETALSLAPAISRLPETLKKQVEEHSIFNEGVQSKKELMKDLHNKGVRIQLSCEKKDAIPMKNKLVSLKHAIDKVVLRNSERTRQMDLAAADSQLYFESRDELVEWIDASVAQFDIHSVNALSNVGGQIREFLENQKAFQDQINRRSSAFEITYQLGKSLEDHAPSAEKKTILKLNETLKEKWEALNTKSVKHQRSLEEALAQSGKFDEIMAEMLGWLESTLRPLEKDVASENQMGDVDTIHTLLAEHFNNIVESIDAHRPNLETLRQRAQEIIDSGDASGNKANTEEIEKIKKQIEQVDAEWKRLENASSKKEECLTNSLTKAVDLSEMLHEFQDFVKDIESKVRRIPIPSNEEALLKELKNLSILRTEISHKSAEYQKILELARHIHANCHPRAELVMRDLIRSLTGRWELLNQLTSEKNEKLDMRLEAIRQHEKQLASLFEFIDEKKSELSMISESDDHGHLSSLLTLLREHSMFKADLHNRQSDVDDCLKTMKKTTTPTVQIQLPTPTSPLLAGKGKSSEGSTPSKKSSMTTSITLNSKLIKSSNPASSDKQTPISPRQQKTNLMAEKWKALLADTLAYEERLKARREHLEELKRLEGFTFDEWRERYLAWNDHGKARISDLFRRIDKSGTGVVPRKLFIDGILASKFPTTELEMGKVADEFDKGDGLISAKEFMNALRFDPKKRRFEPKTETERIHEEIARETSRCTCAHRFPIQHISSNNNDNVQYGFGFGSSMKRMVRILRSTVMVRVGGGWEPLDKFLLKHDPCRTKNRINIGMFYDNNTFGSMDRMASFTTRKNSAPQSLSPGSSLEVSPISSTGLRLGPIMKIREKTERSVPMFKKPSTPKSPTSTLFSTPFLQPKRRGSDDLVINSESRIPRPTSSQKGSRQNLFENFSSRPPSRCSSLTGSDISDILRPTRIPSYRGPKSSTSSRNGAFNNSGATGGNTSLRPSPSHSPSLF